MRGLSILLGTEEEGGKQYPIWHKNSGFVKNQEVAREVVTLAGWPVETGFGVVECTTDDTFDEVSFDEDRANAQLLGNEDYGYVDGDSTNQPYRYQSPQPDESWIFVLNARLYLS